MFFCIDHFQVIEEQIRVLCDLKQHLFFNKARGIYSPVDALSAARLEKFNQELGIEQRLAPGEGDTASRMIEEGPLFFNNLKKLCDRIVAPRHLRGQRRANFSTLTTESTKITVSDHTIRSQAASIYRASAAALTAPDAFGCGKEFLDFW